MSEQIDPVTGNDYQDMYLDYLNDYLTVDRFAEDYSITVSEALVIIDKGRTLNHKTILDENKQ